MKLSRSWLGVALVGLALGMFGCQPDNESAAQIGGKPPETPTSYADYAKKQEELNKQAQQAQGGVKKSAAAPGAKK